LSWGRWVGILEVSTTTTTTTTVFTSWKHLHALTGHSQFASFLSSLFVVPLVKFQSPFN
jgi:hypothetical protein